MLAPLLDRLRFVREHRWTRRHASEYLDGELDRVGTQRAERHIGKCPECDELLASLGVIVRTLAAIGGAPQRDVAAAVLFNVRRRLAGQRRV